MRRIVTNAAHLRVGRTPAVGLVWQRRAASPRPLPQVLLLLTDDGYEYE
jgi:hypothetical protein